MDYPPGVGRGRFLRVLTAALPSAGVFISRTYGAARDYQGPKPREGQVVLVYDFETMGLLAALSFEAVQVIRTAAPTALATRALARTNVKRVAILGSGKHARGQLFAVHAVRQLEEVRVYSPRVERREAFAQETSDMVGVPVRAVTSVEEAVDGADVICLATNSRTPVLRGDLLRPGMHVNSIASYEVDYEVVRRSRVVVSSSEQVLRDAPPRDPYAAMVREGLLREEDLACELSDLVTGRAGWRADDEEITLFASAGHALWDAAIAAKAYQLARERGIGRQVSMV
jgi:alanine dehydrogenase